MGERPNESAVGGGITSQPTRALTTRVRSHDVDVNGKRISAPRDVPDDCTGKSLLSTMDKCLD